MLLLKLGLIFKLCKNIKESCTLGITGDTAYCNEAAQILSPFFSECDIVVVHISTVADLDPRKVDKLIHPISSMSPVDGFRGYYKKHLGFWGTVSFFIDLLSSSVPINDGPLILLNEFGEEFLPIRTLLCEEINRCVKRKLPKVDNMFCYPSDIGTRVSLEDVKILCQFGKVCQKPAGNRKSQYPSPLEIILDESDPTVSHQNWRDRQLVYLCDDHQWVTEHNDYNVFF